MVKDPGCDRVYSANPVMARHAVYYYQNTTSLINRIADYVEAGIRNNESCILFITPNHAKLLTNSLRSRIDMLAAQKSGQYIVYDAAAGLRAISSPEQPDYRKFLSVIHTVRKRTPETSAGIRLYGEMVALLWQQNNRRAVLQLEALWNRYLSNSTDRLLCAYPMLHFDTAQHSEVLQSIDTCHDSITPRFTRSYASKL